MIALLGGCASVPQSRAAADETGDREFMSVGRLLTHADGQPVTPLPPSVSSDMRKSLAVDQVMMFVSGVIDSGEGQRWCVGASGRSRFDVSRAMLQALRSDNTPARPAAAALAQELSASYPCRGRGARPEQAGLEN